MQSSSGKDTCKGPQLCVDQLRDLMRIGTAFLRVAAFLDRIDQYFDSDTEFLEGSDKNKHMPLSEKNTHIS